MLEEWKNWRDIFKKIDATRTKETSKMSSKMPEMSSYDKLKERKIGFDFVRGEGMSVLISGSHGACPVKLEGTKGFITKEEVEQLNASAKNKKARYGFSEDGCVTIGKQYLDAEQRAAGYRADTNVDIMCAELFSELSDKSKNKRPEAIIYRMPQIYSEPNKVDANNKGSEVISLEIYEKIGAVKLKEYVLMKGVNSLSVRDVIALRNGSYEKLAILEKDEAKKEALLECNERIKKIDREDLLYKEIISSLGVLKIHREYFEKQEELLYKNGKVKRPINLEIHTCFDRLRTDEGTDLVIGTRQGSSVAEPEMEYLLALFFRKNGFHVCLSTLNSFPEIKEERRKKSLEEFIQRGSSAGMFDEKNLEKMKKIESLSNEEDLSSELESIFKKRLEFIWQREAGQKNILLYLKTEQGGSFNEKGKTKEQLFELAWLEYEKKIKELTIEDKKLKIKQELANLSMSQLLDADRLRSGLSGLTSLDAKFNAREKYRTKKGLLPLPAIFQIEIVQSIMRSEEKRKKLQQAFSQFVHLTEKNNFDAHLELNALIKEING